MAGRVIAAAGAALAIIAIFLHALYGTSYWDQDGTVAGFGLGFGILALLLATASYAGQPADGWLFACGGVMIGYWGWLPAVTAFDDWDQTGAGTWLAFVGGILVAVGAAISLWLAGPVRSTPAGTPPPALVAGLGIALVFPGVFLDARDGTSYWNASGHSLGIVILILAIAAGLTWAASVAGMATRGLDSALTLILLGLLAFTPIDAAFNSFGSLDSGAWLALAGGILAAGGTWAARGGELPRAVAAPVG